MWYHESVNEGNLNLLCVSSEKLALRIACAVTGFSKLFVPVSLASDLLSLSSCPFCVVCG